MSANQTFGERVVCFASSAAVQIEATQRHKDGVPIAETVSIELCPVQNRRPDWKSKVSVQLSEDELPIYAAVLLGYLPKAEFKRPEKGIYIERQKSKIYYRASAGSGHLYQVPVPIGKSFNAGILALKQLSVGHGDPEFVLAALKGSSALYQI